MEARSCAGHFERCGNDFPLPPPVLGTLSLSFCLPSNSPNPTGTDHVRPSRPGNVLERDPPPAEHPQRAAGPGRASLQRRARHTGADGAAAQDEWPAGAGALGVAAILGVSITPNLLQPLHLDSRPQELGQLKISKITKIQISLCVMLTF